MKIISTIFFILLISHPLLAQGGFVVWSKQLNDSTTVCTVYSDDKIFYSSTNGTITCLDNNGNIIWELETGGINISSPVLENDLLIAATYEGDLLIINADTGDLIQTIGIGEYITSNISIIDITQSGMKSKAIVVGTDLGNFYCYDLEKLEQIWDNHSAKNNISSSIAVSDNKIFFQDDHRTIYCVSANNGLLFWNWKSAEENIDSHVNTNLFVKDDNLFFVDSDRNLHCINILLGTEKWNLKKINASGIIRANNLLELPFRQAGKNELILPTTKNKILVVSIKSGKIIDEIALPINDVSVTDVLVLDKIIIAGFSNGAVYKIKLKGDFENIFISPSAIVSLTNVEGYCLMTDHDGNLTLLKLSE